MGDRNAAASSFDQILGFAEEPWCGDDVDRLGSVLGGDFRHQLAQFHGSGGRLRQGYGGLRQPEVAGRAQAGWGRRHCAGQG